MKTADRGLGKCEDEALQWREKGWGGTAGEPLSQYENISSIHMKWKMHYKIFLPQTQKKNALTLPVIFHSESHVGAHLSLPAVNGRKEKKRKEKVLGEKGQQMLHNLGQEIDPAKRTDWSEGQGGCTWWARLLALKKFQKFKHLEIFNPLQWITKWVLNYYDNNVTRILTCSSTGATISCFDI